MRWWSLGEFPETLLYIAHWSSWGHSYISAPQAPGFASLTINLFIFHISHVPLLTFVLQSLTVQSKDEVTNRWEKSTGPTALWQLMPVTGPWWPSNISQIPALLQANTALHSVQSVMCKYSVYAHRVCVPFAYTVYVFKCGLVAT